MTKTLTRAINLGLKFLSHQQLADGSFASYSSSSMVDFKGALTYRTSFVPAVMLGALSAVDQTEAQIIKRKLAGYLRRQISPAGSCNYWQRGSAEALAFPYPDDMDDTSCAWSALARYQGRLDEADLARLVRLLLTCEVQPGGPYRTWLTTKASGEPWQDVDLAVNANINFLLTLVARPLPKLTAFIDAAIRTQQISSPYYPSHLPILYFMCRGYTGQYRNQLAGLINSELQKPPASAMQTALMMSAAGHLGDFRAVSSAANQLLKVQRPDGSWPAAAFCLDPARNGQKYYHGAPALTTALAIEALTHKINLTPTAKAISSTKPTSQDEKPDLRQKVLSQVDLDCQKLKPEVAEFIKVWLTKIANSNSGLEIINLAQEGDRSLIKPNNNQVLLVRLGLANLYGWCAYTIYDKCLDNDGHTQSLPLANIAMRWSLDLFLELAAGDKALTGYVKEVFDTIDDANYWEVNNCRWQVKNGHLKVGRLPDYGQLDKLAERSLGHFLPLAAVMSRAGFKVPSQGFQQLQKAICHYLVARQLNDDLHDWQDDLKAGRISYVAGLTLRQAKLSAGWHGVAQLNANLQPLFWKEVLPTVLEIMSDHTNKALLALDGLKSLSSNSALHKRVAQLQTSVAESQRQQISTQRFLAAYQAS